MKESEYNDKMMQLLEDKNVYKKIKSAPGKKLHRKVDVYIDNLIK